MVPALAQSPEYLISCSPRSPPQMERGSATAIECPKDKCFLSRMPNLIDG